MKVCLYCGKEPVARKYCKACRKRRANDQQLAWNRAHPENGRKAQRKYRAMHPELVTKRKTMFGVTETEFKVKLEQQGNKCAICNGTDAGVKGWNFDHDHAKAHKDPIGHRGILCRSCNLMLGNAKDDVAVLALAIQYLEKWRK
jgi:hypothetical protein